VRLGGLTTCARTRAWARVRTCGRARAPSFRGALGTCSLQQLEVVIHGRQRAGLLIPRSRWVLGTRPLKQLDRRVSPDTHSAQRAQRMQRPSPEASSTHTTTAPAHLVAWTQAPGARGGATCARAYVRARPWSNLYPLTLGRLGRAPTAAARGGRLRPWRRRSSRPMGRLGRAPTAAARGDRLRPPTRTCTRPMGRLWRAPTAAARGGRRRPPTRTSTRPTRRHGRVPTAAARGGRLRPQPSSRRPRSVGRLGRAPTAAARGGRLRPR